LEVTWRFLNVPWVRKWDPQMGVRLVHIGIGEQNRVL
jgi:hypothetical protein